MGMQDIVANRRCKWPRTCGKVNPNFSAYEQSVNNVESQGNFFGFEFPCGKKKSMEDLVEITQLRSYTSIRSRNHRIYCYQRRNYSAGMDMLIT